MRGVQHVRDDHGSGRRLYTGRADVIAVHLPEPHRVFIVPVGACPTSKGYLRIDATRNKQQRRIRFAAGYELARWLSDLGPWAEVDPA
jgi:hypothetical protein